MRWKKYHEASSVKRFTPAASPLDWPKSFTEVYYKGYPRFDRVKLPPARPIPVPLSGAFRKRASCRTFSRDPVSLDALGTLLSYGAGHGRRNGTGAHFRHYPSAGARYPLEFYYLSLNSAPGPGLFHYYVRSHELEALPAADTDPGAFTDQDWIKRAGGLIIMTAVINRTVQKYGERGYRYVLLEAGHAAENISLAAAGMGLGCCAVGGFNDRRLQSFLAVDGGEEPAIYILVIGRKKVNT